MRKLGTLFAVLLLGVFVITPAVAGAHEDMNDDDNKFSVRGQLWTRGEYYNNMVDFDDDLDDEFDMFQFRARIGVKADLGSNVFVYTEFQNYDFWGNRDDTFQSSPIGRPRPPLQDTHNTPQGAGQCGTFGCGFLGNMDVDTNAVSLYQGFIGVKEVGGSSFSFKLGRQEIKMGSELILGDLDWYGGISHDGFVGGWDLEDFDIKVLYTRVDESITDFEEDFWGGWVDWTWGDSTIQSTAYLFNDRDDALGSDFWTVGGRAWQYAEDHQGWSWSIEYAMQTGDATATVDQDADVIEGWISYGFGGNRNQWVRLGYTAATGNDTTTPGDFEGFDPLFQDFHNRLGLADFFTTSNIEAIEAGYGVMFGDNHKFGVDYYTFSLEEDSGTGVDDLGTEIDVWYKFKYTENLDYDLGIAYFSPDDVLTGGAGFPDDSGYRIWGQVKARF